MKPKENHKFESGTSVGSRSRKILGLLQLQNEEDGRQRKNKPNLNQKNEIKPPYINLFDNGRWEELDSILRKDCLATDGNVNQKNEIKPPYINLFDNGRWEELDSILRKDCLATDGNAVEKKRKLNLDQYGGTVSLINHKKIIPSVKIVNSPPEEKELTDNLKVKRTAEDTLGPPNKVSKYDETVKLNTNDNNIEVVGFSYVTGGNNNLVVTVNDSTDHDYPPLEQHFLSNLEDTLGPPNKVSKYDETVKLNTNDNNIEVVGFSYVTGENNNLVVTVNDSTDHDYPPLEQHFLSNLDISIIDDEDILCSQFEEDQLNYLIPNTSVSNICDKNKNDFDDTDKQIFIQEAVKQGQRKDKRVYDKRHVCFYCHKHQIKITRHLSTVHKDEIDVAKLLAMPKDAKSRTVGFMQLLRMGDFFHNQEVLSMQQGELVVVRRPSEFEGQFFTYNDFGPCPYCTGFMLKKHLWHHARTCFAVDKNKTSSDEAKHSLIHESNALLHSFTNADLPPSFKSNVIDKLLTDEVGKCAKTDKLIVEFGLLINEKPNEGCYELTRQCMRQLARLVIQLRKGQNNARLSDYIDTNRFDDIVNAVRELCFSSKDKFITEPDGKKIPSLALKIGFHLQKCVGLLRGAALRKHDKETDRKLTDFLELYKLEWRRSISAPALEIMKNAKMNDPRSLPLTEDLIKINDTLRKRLQYYTDVVDVKQPESDSWLQLAKLVLCRIILFNKKRSGEASRMTVLQYASQPDWKSENTSELEKSLSPLEKHLAQSLKLIQIIGKKGRIVPVILTQEVIRGINVLLTTRSAVGVSVGNPYIFARPNCNSTRSLRGADCIRDLVQSMNDLKKPSLITSIKLRKYIATVSQVLDLSEREQDWLARHLGHDIMVHRDFYRLHESAIELTKVSKLLIAVDQGRVSEFKGKSLDDIDLEDLADESFNKGEDENDESFNQEEDENDESFNQEEDENDKDFELDETELSVPLVEPRIEVEERQSRPSNPKPGPSSKINEKMTWTSYLRDAAIIFFRNEISAFKAPNKEKCERFLGTLEMDTLEMDIPWRKVKDFVHNHIKKIKKSKK